MYTRKYFNEHQCKRQKDFNIYLKISRLIFMYCTFEIRYNSNGIRKNLNYFL